MKTFYKICSPLLLLTIFTASRLFAQEAVPTKPTIGSNGKKTPILEQFSVQPNGLTANQFSKYKKNAEKVPGIKVLGYCKSENLVMLQIERNDFMTSVPAGKVSQDWKDHPEQLPYDNFFMFLTNNLTISTGVTTEMSLKPVFEVMNKCPDCVNCIK